MLSQQSKTFSMLTDKDYNLISKIETQISNGEHPQTFYPGKLWRLPNGEWYEFFTNIDNCKLEHITFLIMNLSSSIEDKVKYKKEAYDIWGNLLTDQFSVWVKVNKVPDYLLSELLETSANINVKYKHLLLEAGLDADELPKSASDLYLGCEKDLWPDKPWIADKIDELLLKKNS